MYKYYQPNKKDLKDNYCDCVVRAFSKAFGKSWAKVFDELVSIAKEYQCMPNDKLCYEKCLSNNGFVLKSIGSVKGHKRPTVDSFSKEHKVGTYVLVVANHLVCTVDGNYYDTWDSGSKSMYSYWQKE